MDKVKKCFVTKTHDQKRKREARNRCKDRKANKVNYKTDVKQKDKGRELQNRCKDRKAKEENFKTDVKTEIQTRNRTTM